MKSSLTSIGAVQLDFYNSIVKNQFVYYSSIQPLTLPTN